MLSVGPLGGVLTCHRQTGKWLCASILVNVRTHVAAADYGFVVTPFLVPRLFWQQSCLSGCQLFQRRLLPLYFENILFCRHEHVTAFISRL